MIHHWKGFYLEITDFDYHHDPTPTGEETVPSQTSNSQTFRDYRSFRYTYIGFIIGKVLTRRSQILIITIIRHAQVKLYQLKPQILKHREIKMFQINLHMILHWKGFELEIRVFNYHQDPTASSEAIPSRTSNPQTCRD